ncbi:MAG: hypothetical protein WDO18_13525 [Acidobacteriota bacterium]
MNLSVPVPRTAAGKPDLTGVWAHEKTSPADFKRLLGPDYDPAKQTTLIGMENEAVHKYGFNIMLDLKPGEVELRPAGDALMKQRLAERRVDNVCHGEYGWPVAGLLAEPFKIVQAPKETVILYEVDNLHRQVFTDGRKLPAEFQLPAYLGYSVGPLGRRDFRHRYARLQRSHPAGRHRPSPQRSHARHRTFPPPRLRTPRYGNDLRRSNDVYGQVHRQNFLHAGPG